LTLFLYRFFTQDVSGLRHRNELFLFIGLGMAGSFVWLINLYFIKNLQILHVFFIMRIFYFIKPLLIFLVVTAAVHLYRSARSKADYCIAFLFIMTPFFFSPSIALIIVTSCAVSVAGKRWWPALFVVLSMMFLLLVWVTHHSSLTDALLYLKTDIGGNEFNIFQTLIMVVTILFILLVMRRDDQDIVYLSLSWKESLFIILLLAFTLSIPAKISSTIRHGLRGHPILNFHPEDYWGVRTGDPFYAELLDWVRGTSMKFFVIPPYDDRFMTFRYLTGKGIYAQQWDIPQLAYSPKYYYIGYERLLQLGLDTGNQLQFRWNWNYETRCKELIENVQADAIIFEKQRMKTADCSTEQPLFDNELFVAYRTSGRLKVDQITKQ